MSLKALSVACVSVAMLVTGDRAIAQHFAKPDPIDPTTVKQIGEPVFTIARPTTSFGSVSADGWLYVIGGYAGRPHDYYREAQSRDFYRVNLMNPSHVEALPNDVGMQACPLESWNGWIIRTGGLVALNAKGEDQSLRSLDSVGAFDPATGSWNDLPQMPRGRSSHDTAIVGSTLYVVGGWSLDTESGDRSWFNEMYTLDLADPSGGWSTIDQPFERRALASVAFDDRVIVIGGIVSEGKLSSSVNIYDTATGTWSTGPDFPHVAFGIAAETIDGKIVASASNGRMYSWTPGDASWEYTATLTFPRFFHQIARGVDDDLLVFGGIGRGVRPVHVERIDMSATPRATQAVHHWTIPSPSPAKNRQGMFMEDGWLYAFGGNNSTGQHDFEPTNFLSDGYRLSLSSFQWREFSELPKTRQSIQTVQSPDGSTYYAVGGFSHDGEVARTFNDAFAFDAEDKAWRECGPVLPAPRSQFGLTQHNGKFWVFGGLDYDSRRQSGDQFRHLTSILSSDAESGQPEFTETGIELPRPRRAFGGATLDGRYYLVGGMREDFQIVEACDVFDFESETFSTIPPPSRPRLSPQLVALGGKLYIAGGSSPKAGGSGLEANRTIEVYDPDAREWSTLLSDIPISPRHLRMMPFRGRLLIVSSHVDEHDLAHVVLIDPAQVQSHGPLNWTSASNRIEGR